MKARMLRIASCRICAIGNVGIRVSASGRRVVAMCDDCDAVWADPNLHDGPYLPGRSRRHRAVDCASLRRRPAHWARHDEAEEAGWADCILEEAEARETVSAAAGFRGGHGGGAAAADRELPTVRMRQCETARQGRC